MRSRFLMSLQFIGCGECLPTEVTAESFACMQSLMLHARWLECKCWAAVAAWKCMPIAHYRFDARQLDFRSSAIPTPPRRGRIWAVMRQSSSAAHVLKMLHLRPQRCIILCIYTFVSVQLVHSANGACSKSYWNTREFSSSYMGKASYNCSAHPQLKQWTNQPSTKYKQESKQSFYWFTSIIFSDTSNI